MIELADVNALVTLAWPNHVHHAQARAWCAEVGDSGWATCPLTEAGFVRVSSNRRVIRDACGVAESVGDLRALRSAGRHQFWADDVSPADCEEVDFAALSGYRQITDAMLVALAGRRAGTLVAFDGAAAKIGRSCGVEIRLLGL